MSSELSLVTELAIILIAAGVFTVISKALKQPLILGYIVAGFLVGPKLGILPQFSTESVRQWSEIGIIFLLFGLGLEFNFKKLLNVGSAAILSTLTKCMGMFAIGFITGSALGWTAMESVFLGAMMGMSSTTIIIKAYEDLGIKSSPQAPLVFGSLVVEDLLAVLILVLLSTVATSNGVSGIETLKSLANMVIFLVLCVVVGIYVIPTLFKRAGRFISDEILLLISIGLCFLLVFLANMLGLSSALGAFLMGSILSSTIEGERIAGLVVNIKNLFGAIFFISVGMMVDPQIIARHWQVILVLTLVTMVGIPVFSTLGALIAGKTLDTALHAGFSLAQLGEFAFIIAGLGVSIGVVSPFIYPVIIAVSVVTTFTTPYMIKAAGPVSLWMYRILPDKIIGSIDRRSQNSESENIVEQNLWKFFFRKYFARIATYGILLLIIIIGLNNFLPGLTKRIFPDISDILASAINVCVSLLVMSPFLYGLAVHPGDLGKLAGKLVHKNPKAKFTLIATSTIRVLIAVQFALSAFLIFVHVPHYSIIVVTTALVGILFMAHNLMGRNVSALERRFLRNLNEKENYDRQMAPVATSVSDSLGQYDVHTLEITIDPAFEYIGCTLREMPFRSSSGVNIAKISRGGKSILVPSGSERIYPGDRLVAVGTNEQLKSFKSLVDGNTVVGQPDNEEFVVEPIVLLPESQLTGMALKNTNLRPSGCLVVSVKRGGTIFTNPHKDFIFEAGDIVWIAGLKSSIDWIKK